MPDNPQYRIYIDEVGNSDLGSAENSNHRFLSLTGVIISLEHVREAVNPEMEAIKKRFFGSHPDDPVILHRKEIVNARYPFHALKDDSVRKAFDVELLRLLSYWEYSVITVVIDKLEHKNQYTTWRYDPYHYCLAVLLERFVFFLQQRREKGDAMAESRGGKEDRRLKSSYENLFKEGTVFVKPESFNNCLSSCQLKIKTKLNNISGLQLADILAHPSRREIMKEFGKSSDERCDLFSDEVISILGGKYYSKDGRIYGKKMLP